MKEYIIIFDGYCLSCNKFINYVINHDKGVFKLATQYSPAYPGISEHLDEYLDPATTIYLIKDRKEVRSQAIAIAEILEQCGSFNAVLATLIRWLPAGFSNYCYNLFSRKRYLFNRDNQCPVPSRKLTERLL